MTLRDRIERVVDELFVNGSGARAERQVLVDASGRDLGGWCRGAIVDRVVAAFEGGTEDDARQLGLELLDMSRKIIGGGRI